MTTEYKDQILITASGVCPLVLVPNGSDTFQYAAFVYIDDTRHIPSLKINGAEVGAWLTGRIKLSVKRGDQELTGITKRHDFDKVINLDQEIFFNPFPKKDFATLTAHFEIGTGLIFPYKLLEHPVDFLRGRVEPPILYCQEVATEIGVLIELNPGEEATLRFEDHNIEIKLQGARFHIELDNSCNEASHRCPKYGDQNDFLLNYKILRLEGQKPISIKIASPDSCNPGDVRTASVPPRICGSLALMLDRFDKKPDPDDYIQSLASILDRAENSK